MQYDFNLRPVDFVGQYMRGKTFREEMEELKRKRQDTEEAKAKLKQKEADALAERELIQDMRIANYYMDNGMYDQALAHTDQRMQRLSQQGRDVSDTGEIYDLMRSGDYTTAHGMLKAGLAGLGQLQEKSKDDKQKGEGALVFDPNTGKYSIDPIAQAELDRLAEKKQKGIKLSLDEKRKLNQDIGKFTKSAVEIKNTAKELEQLSKIPSGPASIAAVFKFMKALDPQSVVREGEFATAENSAGVPETIRNIYNRISKGERLGEKQFSQFIDTAKQLSNTATLSAKNEAEKYLIPLQDEFSLDFRNKLMDRIPSLFDIGANNKNQDEKDEFEGFSIVN